MTIKILKELFTCPIGREIIKEPFFSECGHVFDKEHIGIYCSRNKN
jgi:hypothetical protein